ncbi:MAG: hypothetical protein ACQETD_11515, partial [Pseudomonadota bacterium]
ATSNRLLDKAGTDVCVKDDFATSFPAHRQKRLTGVPHRKSVGSLTEGGGWRLLCTTGAG